MNGEVKTAYNGGGGHIEKEESQKVRSSSSVTRRKGLGQGVCQSRVEEMDCSQSTG